MRIRKSIMYLVHKTTSWIRKFMYFLENQFIGSNLEQVKLGFIIVPNCFFLWFKAEPQCVTPICRHSSQTGPAGHLRICSHLIFCICINRYYIPISRASYAHCIYLNLKMFCRTWSKRGKE